MSLKKIKGALAQYLVSNKSPEIGVDGKLLPLDPEGANINRITGANDRVGRSGWCYVGGSNPSTSTFTFGGSYSLDTILADKNTGAGWVSDVDVTTDLSGRVLTLTNNHKYKNIRSFDPSNNLTSKHNCEEESGTIGYNVLSTTDHATLGTGVTHQQDNDVTYSDANDRGYNLDGLVVIPLLEDLSSVANGGTIQYLGEYKPYAQIEGSPAASFNAGGILNFLYNTAGVGTHPSAVEIVGEATKASYNPVTGNLVLNQGGIVEYAIVDGFNVYLTAGVGNRIWWERPSDGVKLTISLPAQTWVTTNKHAFLQAKGGNKKLLTQSTTSTNAITIAQGDFSLEIIVNYYLGVFITANTASVQFGSGNNYIFTNYNGSSFLTYIVSGNINLPDGGKIALFSSPALPNFKRTIRAKISITYNRASNEATAIYTDLDTGNFVTKTTTSQYGTIIDILNDRGTTADFFKGNNAVATDFTLSSTAFATNSNQAYVESVKIAENLTLDTPKYDWQNLATGSITDSGTSGNNLTGLNLLSGYIPSALDASGNSTGLDVLGNPIPDAHLSGRGLRKGLSNTVNLNPEAMPALTQAGIASADSVSVEDLATMIGKVQVREQTSEMVSNITLFSRPPQAKLVLDSTTDSNTITFAAGSFAANGIVSATSGSGKTAITLGTDSITVADGLELYYVRFLNASGELVELVPCHEGSGTEIKGIRGLLTGTIGGTTSAVWQTQNDFDAGLLFGEEEVSGVKHPGKVNTDFFPEGISTRSGSTSIDNLPDVLKARRAFNLSKKEL